MNTYEKTQFIINYSSSHTDEDVPSIKGWAALCYLYNANDLSNEFKIEMKKEIDSIYDMIYEPNKVEKEKRIPALHAKGTLHRFFLPSTKDESPRKKHSFRVKDDSEEGFTDYDITHYDLEVMILDSSAEFVQNENGNFLDYTKDALV